MTRVKEIFGRGGEGILWGGKREKSMQSTFQDTKCDGTVFWRSFLLSLRICMEASFFQLKTKGKCQMPAYTSNFILLRRYKIFETIEKFQGAQNRPLV